MGGSWGRIGTVEMHGGDEEPPALPVRAAGREPRPRRRAGLLGQRRLETSSSASVNADGTVNLVLGSVDIGGTRAVARDAAGRDAGHHGRRTSSRRSSTPTPSASPASRPAAAPTFAGGWAAYELGRRSAAQMVERAAQIWECDADEVTYGDDGVIRGPEGRRGQGPRSSPSRSSPGQLGRDRRHHRSRASTSTRTPAGPAFAGHIVDVEVDPETGKVTILRYTAVQDVGTAIHPSYVEGQIQGGVAQGIGMALTEEYFYDADGRMLNASFLDYRMPTALDLPMIETVLVEVPNPGHPYGVRGVGEVPIVPPLAAVQQARSPRPSACASTTCRSRPRDILDALYRTTNGASVTTNLKGRWVRSPPLLCSSHPAPEAAHGAFC